MNSPQQPPQHPKTPTPAASPSPDPNGVPAGATEADAKGSPTSDRQDSETAAKP